MGRPKHLDLETEFKRVTDSKEGSQDSTDTGRSVAPKDVVPDATRRQDTKGPEELQAHPVTVTVPSKCRAPVRPVRSHPGPLVGTGSEEL